MKTNTNSEYWERITAYFSKDLIDDELINIEEWADGQDRKELLMEMKRKMTHIEKASFMYNDKTDSAWDKLNYRIKQEEEQEMNFFSMNRNFIGIAASIVVLLSIGFGILRLLQNDLQMNSLQTALNQSQVELSDGTVVYLNGNSSLDYPTEFSGESRLVKLIGEAYFDVKPNKDHPFIVETDNARIQVLGTSFNVRASGLEGEVEVLVNSGKVRIRSVKTPEKELILEEGDFASLKNNELQNIAKRDVNYLAWQTKMLDFDKTPLHEVVQTLNRAYVVKIDLAEEKLGELPLTSKYNQMSVDALLDAMCLTFKLDQKIEGDRIILYSSTP
ncbi:MAG: FecR domain-containing protein [Bacteroidales bacterium]|jgi:transmembrane sensor|nr:FecR domain-containing protein [Bacteroidales bacterium]